MAENKNTQAPRAAAKPAPPKAIPRTAKPAPYRAPLPKSLQPQAPKRVDTSSPAYKAAAGKYTRFMVAMPILLVTTYVLYDRLVVGSQAKSLRGKPTNPAPDAA